MKVKNWKLKIFSLALFLGFCAPPAGSADASAEIGFIQKAGGKVSLIRQGQTVPAHTGLKILRNDTLETGIDGSVGIVFSDQTQLSLGPDSHLSIDDYVFAPKKGKFSIVLKMMKGTAVYLSGLIAKLAPDSARFETPSASVGIRGTKFAVRVEGRP
jgi:hypothetical protein